MSYYEKPFPSDERFYEDGYDPHHSRFDSDARADEDDNLNDDGGYDDE
jgi:hypothetical protein